MEPLKNIVVRMAPSPTGNLHIGGIRTALFNFLFARHNQGTYVLRIEDTDKERSTKEFEQNILDSFEWVNLPYDKFFRQSERTAVYSSYVQKMIDAGTAYISKEEIKEEGQRAEVIRFKNPNKKIVFEDIIRGTIEFDTTELGDFVIARSIEEPLYHLAVVVDDFEMGITHVIRGEEHLSNTPRQILILEAIGGTRPQYAHIPLILAPDRSKLSKRHGAVSVFEYKNEGFLPEAVVNYLALLGWNPGGEKEIFTLQELIEAFDITRVQKGGAIFDIEKLKWFNKEHIKLLPESVSKTEVHKAIEASTRFQEKKWSLSDEAFEKSWKIIFERIHTWSDATKAIDSEEFDFIFEKPTYETELLYWKEEKDNAVTAGHLKKVAELLTSLSAEDFTEEKVKETIIGYATEMGKGSVLWPTRVSLSGKGKSPDPFTLAHILGKDETLERLRIAREKLV